MSGKAILGSKNEGNLRADGAWSRTMQFISRRISSLFSERDTYVHVRYMLSAVCLSSVCLLSVTLVRPTEAVEIFGNFFHHTIAQGL